MPLDVRVPEEARGAYGLTLRGLPGAGDLLVPAAPDWPELTVRQSRVDRIPATAGRLDSRAGRFSLSGRTSALELSRDPLRLHARMLEEWPDGSIVHPFLATPAVVVSRWLRRDAFHAGAFVGEGGAWAVAGARRAGKSTLLAGLALRGVPVLADDLLVLAGGVAFAGPRCIDLRPDAGARLGGRDLGVVGDRPRSRLPLGPAPAEVPLRGWLLPSWGPRLRLTKLPPARRLPALVRNLSVSGAPPDPGRLLDLAALPAYELARPRSWAAAGHVTDVLMNL